MQQKISSKKGKNRKKVKIFSWSVLFWSHLHVLQGMPESSSNRWENNSWYSHSVHLRSLVRLWWIVNRVRFLGPGETEALLFLILFGHFRTADKDLCPRIWEWGSRDWAFSALCQQEEKEGRRRRKKTQLSSSKVEECVNLKSEMYLPSLCFLNYNTSRLIKAHQRGLVRSSEQ